MRVRFIWSRFWAEPQGMQEDIWAAERLSMQLPVSALVVQLRRFIDALVAVLKAVVLVVAVTLGIAFYRTSEDPVSYRVLAFSQFVSDVRAGKIGEVRISGDGVIKGVATESGSAFMTRIPYGYSNLYDLLDANGVAYSAAESHSRGWLLSAAILTLYAALAAILFANLRRWFVGRRSQ
jgi:ATP-dependent Zn protease